MALAYLRGTIEFLCHPERINLTEENHIWRKLNTYESNFMGNLGEALYAEVKEMYFTDSLLFNN